MVRVLLTHADGSLFCETPFGFLRMGETDLVEWQTHGFTIVRE
jgi:hypothetical protein